MSDHLYTAEGTDRLSDMPSPTQEELDSEVFEIIWQTIKSWDINVPEYYDGYMGANGSHAVIILRALKQAVENA